MSKNNTDGTKKKPKIGLIVAIVIVCILLVVGVVAMVNTAKKAAEAAMEAMSGKDDGTYEVERQDVRQEMTTTGSVIGLEDYAYTSPVTAKVDEICVEVGQIVHEGDVLLKYDTSELGDNLRKVQIQARSEKAAGNASYETANKAKAKAAAAQKKIDALNGEVSQIKAEMERLSGIIAAYEAQNAAPQMPIPEDDEDAEEDEEEDNGDKKDKEETPAPNPDLIDEATYMQAKAALEEQSGSLAAKQAEIEQLKAVVEAAEDATVPSSTATQISAANELADMSVNDAQESVDKAEAGLVSSFEGIVTSVNVIKGSYATETQTVFTVARLDSVGVEFSIPKDELTAVSEGQKARMVINGKEYTGVVDFVSRVAVSDALLQSQSSSDGTIKGRVAIDKASEDIFLGVAAKTYIFIGESKDALTVPYEALNSDIDGDYVYIVNKENLIERKDVKIGICSDEYYEVLEGISEGDKVIREVTKDMKPGDEYVPPVQTPNMMMLQ